MQNFLWFAREIKAQGTLSLPMEHAETAPIDIHDVVCVGAAILKGEGYEGKTYNLTGSERLSLQEIADKLSAVTNQKITYVNMSPFDFKQILLRSGIPEWFAEAVVMSWQVASQGKPTITDAIIKIGQQQPITFDKFAWDHQALFR